MWKKLQKNIIAGLIVLLPAIATIYILQFIFSLIDAFLGTFITNVLRALSIITIHEGSIYIFNIYTPFTERILGIGFILTILIITWIGSMRIKGKGVQVFNKVDRTFRRIPIANTIYTSVEQIIQAFSQDRNSFKNVVLVEYPRKGIYTIGFQTGQSKGEVQRVTSRECINVFLPTTPNPTSGWLILVPKEDVVELNMTVEQGLKFIISGGVVVPPDIHSSKGIEKKGEFDRDNMQIHIKMSSRREKDE